MENTHAVIRKTGILYPTMLIAAIAVIIFSVVGIATMTGHMPTALSMGEKSVLPSEPTGKSEPAGKSESVRRSEPTGKNKPVATPTATGDTPRGVGTAVCVDCGVVESIRAVQSKGQGSGLGAVAGGVIGGILGNQIGGGGGRTVMTLVGAGAGALTGNEVEKNMNKSVSYQIRVRMNDGTFRTFYEHSQPALGVGQKVRVTSKGVVVAK